MFFIFGIGPIINNKPIEKLPLFFAFGIIFTYLVYPKILKMFFMLWMQVGNFIGKTISKIVLLFLFYLIFTPISIFLKIFGKDLLKKRIDKNINSYWIKRVKQPESMKNQF